jgi:hypothetical protein
MRTPTALYQLLTSSVNHGAHLGCSIMFGYEGFKGLTFLNSNNSLIQGLVPMIPWSIISVLVFLNTVHESTVLKGNLKRGSTADHQAVSHSIRVFFGAISALSKDYHLVHCKQYGSWVRKK